MQTRAREESVLRIVLALFTGWATISLLGYVTENAGSNFFWWVFGGFLFPQRTQYFPIPDSVNTYLWSDFLDLFPREQLLTVALGVLAVAALITKIKKSIAYVIGLAALQVAGRLLAFISWMSDPAYRLGLGAFQIFKWSIIGLIVPLALGLALAALVYPDKYPFLRGITSRLLPGDTVPSTSHTQPSTVSQISSGEDMPPPPPLDPGQVPTSPPANTGGSLGTQPSCPTSVAIGGLLTIVLGAITVLASVAWLLNILSFMGPDSDLDVLGPFAVIIVVGFLFVLGAVILVMVLGIRAIRAGRRLMQGDRSDHNFVVVVMILGLMGGLTGRNITAWGPLFSVIAAVVLISINTKEARAYFAKK